MKLKETLYILSGKNDTQQVISSLYLFQAGTKSICWQLARFIIFTQQMYTVYFIVLYLKSNIDLRKINVSIDSMLHFKGFYTNMYLKKF